MLKVVDAFWQSSFFAIHSPTSPSKKGACLFLWQTFKFSLFSPRFSVCARGDPSTSDWRCSHLHLLIIFIISLVVGYVKEQPSVCFLSIFLAPFLGKVALSSHRLVDHNWHLFLFHNVRNSLRSNVRKHLIKGVLLNGERKVPNTKRSIGKTEDFNITNRTARPYIVHVRKEHSDLQRM